MIEAVLFDLDGTLLDIEIDRLLPPYTELLAKEMADYIPPESFRDQLMTAVMAMIGNTDAGMTNEHVFWDAMDKQTGVTLDMVEERIQRFYERTFPTLRGVARSVDGANDVVAKVASQVKHVVLATNPIFPEVAIRERLAWAGVNPDRFSVITSYEKMHACKPNAEYYEEICAMIDVPAEKCFMVGNDYNMDIVPAAAVGMRTYLVDDVTPAGEVEKAFATQGQVDDGSVANRAYHSHGSLQRVIELLERWKTLGS